MAAVQAPCETTAISLHVSSWHLVQSGHHMALTLGRLRGPCSAVPHTLACLCTPGWWVGGRCFLARRGFSGLSRGIRTRAKVQVQSLLGPKGSASSSAPSS